MSSLDVLLRPYTYYTLNWGFFSSTNEFRGSWGFFSTRRYGVSKNRGRLMPKQLGPLAEVSEVSSKFLPPNFGKICEFKEPVWGKEKWASYLRVSWGNQHIRTKTPWTEESLEKIWKNQKKSHRIPFSLNISFAPRTQSGPTTSWNAEAWLRDDRRGGEETQVAGQPTWRVLDLFWGEKLYLLCVGWRFFLLVCFFWFGLYCFGLVCIVLLVCLLACLFVFFLSR